MKDHSLFKGSMFKSWKKRHFKAAGGTLFYYEVCKHGDHLKLNNEGSSSNLDYIHSFFIISLPRRLATNHFATTFLSNSIKVRDAKRNNIQWRIDWWGNFLVGRRSTPHPSTTTLFCRHRIIEHLSPWDLST